MTSHRKPPLPDPVPGVCRWCGEATPERRTPTGKRHKSQPTWHPECMKEYICAQNLPGYMRRLWERDGKQCKRCGEARGHDVDHVVPLWKVAHLPDAERLEYFKLPNLQLLCWDCHKRKSAAEAAERAKVKRLRGETKQGPKRKIPQRENPWPPRGSRKIPSRKMEARRG